MLRKFSGSAKARTEAAPRFRRSHKLLAWGGAMLLTLGVTTFVGTVASAHTGDLSAEAVCQTNGTYLVTYTLTISKTGLDGSTVWDVGTTTGTGVPADGTGLSKGPKLSSGSGPIVLGTTTVPGTSKHAPWAYAFTTWSDGFTKGSDGGDIDLAGTCKGDPGPKTTYSDWTDGQWACNDTTVDQTRTKTVTPYKLDDNGKWVLDTANAKTTTQHHTRKLTENEAKKCYVIVAWKMPSWVNSTTPTWGQTYVTSEKQTTPDLSALDDDLAAIGYGCYQVDIYYDDATTTALIAGKHLDGSGNPPEHLISGGWGKAYKLVRINDSCIPTKPKVDGGDETKDTQVCVVPNDGTATKTTWTRSWTRDWTWNATTQKWDEGNKVYTDWTSTSSSKVDDDTCVPPDPTALHGDDQGSDQVCTVPADGTATVTGWTQHWDRTSTWDATSHSYVLSAKNFGPKIAAKDSTIVDDATCIPPKPEQAFGDDSGSDQLCTVPEDGTATVTGWTQHWTQDSIWDGAQHKYVLAAKQTEDKVYGAPTYVLDATCGVDICINIDGYQKTIPTGMQLIYNKTYGALICAEPPTLAGSLFSSKCVNDVPWIYYDVRLKDPFGVSTNTTGNATFTFTAKGTTESTQVVTKIGKGRFLWPGATATQNSNGTYTATGWPGWALIDDKWVSVGDDNYGWTRNGVNVHIEVNPTMDVKLSYPPPSALCVAGPPTEIHNELDAPPADAVEAEAQYAG